jgi:hypothetical protein
MFTFLTKNNNNNLYPENDKRLLTGPTRTVYIYNNRGIHRDSPPAVNHWKIAVQMSISRSIFGSEQHYRPSRPKLNSVWSSYQIWQRALREYPEFYNLLFKN